MSELLNDMQPLVENANKIIDIKAAIEADKNIEFTMQQIPSVLGYMVVAELYTSYDAQCRATIENWDEIKKTHQFIFNVAAKPVKPNIQDAEVVSSKETNNQE